MKKNRHPQRGKRADVVTIDDRRRPLPPKLEGQHRWLMVTAHQVTPGQARAHAQGGHVKLDDSSLYEIGVACADCQLPYDDVVELPCAADVDDDC